SSDVCSSDLHAVFSNNDDVMVIGHFNQRRRNWAQPTWVNDRNGHSLFFEDFCGSKGTCSHRPNRNNEDFLRLVTGATLLLRPKEHIHAVYGACYGAHILEPVSFRKTHHRGPRVNL